MINYSISTVIFHNCFLGMFVPNWPMSLTVALGKVCLGQKCGCLREYKMASFPDLEFSIMQLTSKVRLTVTFKSIYSLAITS